MVQLAKIYYYFFSLPWSPVLTFYCIFNDGIHKIDWNFQRIFWLAGTMILLQGPVVIPPSILFLYHSDLREFSFKLLNIWNSKLHRIVSETDSHGT